MAHPYKVSVNERHQFDIEAQAASSLDIVENGAGNWHVLDNRTAFQVELLKTDYANRQYILKVNGHRFEVHISDYYQRLIQQMGLTLGGTHKQNTVKAPMPGLVLDIQVSPGQAVQKGDALLILEAMKMENVIKATGEGVVKSIHVSKGAAVEKGQLLIEME